MMWCLRCGWAGKDEELKISDDCVTLVCPKCGSDRLLDEFFAKESE